MPFARLRFGPRNQDSPAAILLGGSGGVALGGVARWVPWATHQSVKTFESVSLDQPLLALLALLALTNILRGDTPAARILHR